MSATPRDWSSLQLRRALTVKPKWEDCCKTERRIPRTGTRTILELTWLGRHT